MSKKLVTSEVRLSYANLFEPRAIAEGAEPKYSVCILIPKNTKEGQALIKEIEQKIQQIINEDQKTLKSTKGLTLPLRDGDIEKDSPEYEGCMFMNASSKNPPVVVDEDRKAVINAREVYSGCYGRVSVNLFAYNKAGNKGIGVGLNAVQKTADGEPFGGTYTMASVEDDFGDDIVS